MKLDDLKAHLDNCETWSWEPVDGKGAIVIVSTRFETANEVTFEAVERNDLVTILAICKRGKDVDHITRVTGYFSRTSGWNKGKAAELRDRYRSTV